MISSPSLRRDGIELSLTRWNNDVERLLKELDKALSAHNIDPATEETI